MKTYDTYGVLDGDQRALKLAAWMMILLGIFALVAPMVTGWSVVLAFGAIVFLCGVAYLVLAFYVRGTKEYLLRLLVGICFLVSGAYLLSHQGSALLALGLLISLSLVIEGLSEISAFVLWKGRPGRRWLLINALISLALASLMWASWPVSSLWTIGTILGLNLVSSGLTHLRTHRQRV